jgi:hypothetical protein
MTKRVSPLLIVLALLAFNSALQAQPIPGQFIVEFDSEPAVAIAASGKQRLADLRPQLAARRRQIQAEHAVHEAAIQRIGGTIVRRYDMVFNGVAVQIGAQNVDALRGLPGVKAVYPDKRWHAFLDQAVIAQRIKDAWATIGGGASNAGAGVMIALLDTGIDASHPAFQNFSTTMPSGFPITSSAAEAKNANTKVIVSRDYIGTGGADLQGHGTGNAMIAAGETSSAALDYLLFNCDNLTIPENPITGVAPGAWLGNYKVCDDAGGCSFGAFLSALGDVVNDAAALQAATGSSDLRVVANYSVGGPSLSISDENSPEARAIHNAVAAGIPVVVAAGNDGNTPGTISTPALAPDAIAVGSTINQRYFNYSVGAPGFGPVNASVPDTSGDPNMPNIIDPVQNQIVDLSQFDGQGLACDTLPSASLTGKIALIQRGICTFDTKLDNATAAGAMAAIVYNKDDSGLLAMTLSDATLPALFVARADGLNLKSWIASNPNVPVSLDFSGFTQFELSTVDVETNYSSAGPTAAGKLKPDLLAVGGGTVCVDSACSGQGYALIVTADSTSNNPSNPYQVSGGSSLASPFIAGAVAVLKAARPGLTAPQYASLVINSTRPVTSDVKGKATGPAAVGSGTLDLLNAMQTNLTVVPWSINFQSGQGQPSVTKSVVFTNVGSSTDTFTLTVNPLHGSAPPSVDTTSFSLAPGASETINVTMTGSGLTPGSYDGYLSVTGSQSPVSTRVAYWFGVPGNTVQNMSILNQNELDGVAGTPGESDLFIYVRYTDAAGLPVAGDPPTVVAQAPRSRVTKIAPAGDIPGTYEIDIQLGRTSYTYDEFDISAGSVNVPVFIAVY